MTRKPSYKVLNVPNFITFVRTILLIPLIGYIFTKSGLAVATLIIVCRIMDGLDGYLARKYNLQTDFGSKLDSYSDIATDIIMVSGTLYIIPKSLNIFFLFLLLPFMLLFIAWIYGYIKTRKLIIMHLYSNKIFGIMYTIAFISLFLTRPSYTFMTLTFVFGLIATLEQIGIFYFYNKNIDLNKTSIFQYK